MRDGDLMFHPEYGPGLLNIGDTGDAWVHYHDRGHLVCSDGLAGWSPATPVFKDEQRTLDAFDDAVNNGTTSVIDGIQIGPVTDALVVRTACPDCNAPIEGDLYLHHFNYPTNGHALRLRAGQVTHSCQVGEQPTEPYEFGSGVTVSTPAGTHEKFLRFQANGEKRCWISQNLYDEANHHMVLDWEALCKRGKVTVGW